MRWHRTRSTPDVIDQRAAAPRVGLPFPGGRAGAIGGGLGIVGLLVFLAINFSAGAEGRLSMSTSRSATPLKRRTLVRWRHPGGKGPERDLKDFSAYVFNNVQQSWETTFAQQNRPYKRAKLVLYRDAVRQVAVRVFSGRDPLHCPADQRVYLDLGFYRDMASQLGAQGDFAWAYVIAHEMGHHAQQQLGTSSGGAPAQLAVAPRTRTRCRCGSSSKPDCYAGVWADSVYEAGDLEEGDVDEAVTASAAVGDDRLQSRGGGQIDPDSFTHGTSDQRSSWFSKGEDSGEPSACDTFSAEDL